jgi:predicted phosphodiesterase
MSELVGEPQEPTSHSSVASNSAAKHDEITQTGHPPPSESPSPESPIHEPPSPERPMPESPGLQVESRQRLIALSRGALAGLVVLVCSFLGGLALGASWPSTSSSDTYRVSTRLILPSELLIPTNVGTARFDTHGWGPGGRIDVSALELPTIDRAEGRPLINLDAQLEEIKAMARSDAVNSLLKFVGGAAFGGCVGGLVWYGATGRRASRRRVWLTSVASGLVGSLVVTAAWGAGAWLTFHPDYGRKLHADGLLAVGLSSPRLIDQLNSRDQRYAGYVQSLSTYIERLSRSATPAGGAPALRVLLISDLHGRDVYPQLKRVVDTQNIDLVIDSGDLVQWGTGLELTGGLRDGIRSLRVPYLFVKGNHDGPQTLARLAKIRNVTVLDGSVVQLDGLRIVGVPDPRLYEDGGPIAATQGDEVRKIEETAATEAAGKIDESLHPIDLAIMHEPVGARKLGELLDARVWISGHTHVPALQFRDKHVDITVGTTGAAGIRAFNKSDSVGDVVAAEQSFDIIDFDKGCQLVSLARFSYPDSLSTAGNAHVTYQTLGENRDEKSTRSCSP